MEKKQTPFLKYNKVMDAAKRTVRSAPMYSINSVERGHVVKPNRYPGPNEYQVKKDKFGRKFIEGNDKVNYVPKVVLNESQKLENSLKLKRY